MNRAGVLERFEREELIERKDSRWTISNLGAMLFAKRRGLLPLRFHLGDDLFGEALDGFLLGGGDGLAGFGYEVGTLVE